jgi:hypothetical protein
MALSTSVRARELLRRIGRAILLVIATLYFLIDLIFLSAVRPLRRRITGLPWIRRLTARVERLNRYAALVLLLVPWLALEPVKPLGVLLFAHKRHWTAVLLIGGGEIVKLSVFEQLFAMTKPKLLTFRWFAWGYGRWRAALDYLRALPVWQRLRGWYRALRARTIRWMTGQLKQRRAEKRSAFRR